MVNTLVPHPLKLFWGGVDLCNGFSLSTVSVSVFVSCVFCVGSNSEPLNHLQPNYMVVRYNYIIIVVVYDGILVRKPCCVDVCKYTFAKVPLHLLNHTHIFSCPPFRLQSVFRPVSKGYYQGFKDRMRWVAALTQTYEYSMFTKVILVSVVTDGLGGTKDEFYTVFFI